MTSDNQGLLIVFEGADGSGKSTLCRNVTEALLKQERDVCGYAFPTHCGEVGMLIRRVFSGEASVDISAMGHLMVADGLDMEPKVRDQLKRGTTVLYDRHNTVSGWAYQTESHTIDTVLGFQQRHLFTEPDLVVVVDVPVDVALERIRARRDPANPLYEKDVAHAKRIRERYMAFALMHETVLSLDGTQTQEELTSVVMDMIAEMYKERS